jgi:GTPase
MSFHSGFVCILGRPNAGKSTLLNALAGEKLAIISPKPQTTRNRILGVIHVPKQKGRDTGQIVLIDTPGIDKFAFRHSGSSLGRKMMSEVREALEGCDLILLMVDIRNSRRGTNWTAEDAHVLDLAKKAGVPVMLLLNKIDLIADKSKLLPIIAELKSIHDFKEIIPISGLKKKGLDDLLRSLLRALPAGPRYFPEDQITDQPFRFMAAEQIREHVLAQTHEEVPHAVSVLVEQFEEGQNLIRIAATIFCERDGQKAILLGKGGAMLKKVGTGARLEIEKMVGTKVFLELFVKVKPGWRDSRSFVEELDWRRRLGTTDWSRLKTEEPIKDRLMEDRQKDRPKKDQAIKAPPINMGG